MKPLPRRTILAAPDTHNNNARGCTMSQKSIDNRVYGRYRTINRMSPQDIREMYGIFCKYYGNTSLDTFLEDMSKKTGVIVIRRRTDRHIVGFSTVAVLDLHLRGK